MSEEIKFNIKPYKDTLMSSFTGKSSYGHFSTEEIFIYYHKELLEELAWRILIFDVDHECLHIILRRFMDKETSIALDSKLGLEIDMYLYEDLFRDFQKETKKNNTSEILYTNNDGRREKYNE